MTQTKANRRTAKQIARSALRCLTFAPRSLPRRVLKALFQKLIDYAKTKPTLGTAVMTILNYFPVLKMRIERPSLPQMNTSIGKSTAKLHELSPYAQGIYHQLKKAIKTRDSH